VGAKRKNITKEKKQRKRVSALIGMLGRKNLMQVWPQKRLQISGCINRSYAGEGVELWMSNLQPSWKRVASVTGATLCAAA
jgi:hypothetical protein